MTNRTGDKVSDDHRHYGPPAKSDRLLTTVAAFLGFTALVLAGVIGLLIAAPESTNTAFVIQVLLGQFALSGPVFVTAIVSGRNSDKLTSVLNGEGDRKLQDNLHEFIDHTSFEDKVKQQLHKALDERNPNA
jgi:hypothetical protein